MCDFANNSNVVRELELIAEGMTTPIDGMASASYISTPQNGETDLCATASENSSDDDAFSSPEYVPGTFEGPEKTLEVCFRPNVGHEDGLRALSREQLDHLCTKARCSIISKVSSNYIDAYVLSESSLFIYKHKYIMKTCGTTTLLRCLTSLLEFADKLGLELTWVCYSRKNLSFPSAQKWPHLNFDYEVAFLGSHDKLQERLSGAGYILGPITGDHWYVYVADHSEIPMSISAPVSNEITINLMMFDMSWQVGSLFFRSSCDTAREMTMKSGIVDLVPGATIDDTSFMPCGYSMNAILHDSYSTIHVTPEPECSYASFETNTYLCSYSPLVRNVLNVFKPKRFVLTMFGDEAAIKKVELPTESRVISVPGVGKYNRTSFSSTNVEADFCCLMACFQVEQSATPSSSGKFFPLRERLNSVA